MPEVILKINEKSFRLIFGLKLLRILGSKWDLPGINEVVQKIAVLDTVKGNLSFAVMDMLEEILIAAIENGPDGKEDLTGMDILGEFMKDPNALQSFTDSLIESLPQNKPQDDSGKPKARKGKKA